MSDQSVDVVLVGGGVMSATLGVLLKQLDPSSRILMLEQADQVAQESSGGWNNAGTGHAAYCELNYTPQNKSGEIEISKALQINSSFELSLQLWSYLVDQSLFPEPSQFINRTPHISFVWGKDNVEYLKKRHAALSQHHLFAEMEYSEDPETLQQWMPLVMAERHDDEPIAATRIAHGADIDFGAVTSQLIANLSQSDGFELALNSEVTGLKKSSDGWQVSIKNRKDGERKSINTKFVFIGGGGAALTLLQASGNGAGYGGFPVSGQWLVCKKPEIVQQHHAKVYGKAAIGAPPMSVPHLDTRIIDGEPALLFGPFAGFTTKFLKRGSFLDLIKSIRPGNLWPLIRVGLRHSDLTRYLISETVQSHRKRMASLRNYMPTAQDGDWSLAIAGQRVQIIKKDAQLGGKLEFGTEVIVAEDQSLAALLGASPGASTSAAAMLDVLERCFPEKMASKAWQDKLQQMIPSYGQSLIEDKALLQKVRQHTLKTLNLAEKA
ncbi:malate dehydrogenase (quinone) [Reinekea thalattae]|uniref:Probable malate:quinone oxidoreductase n=1 Tax=Reinekea thalattae TaxID=2593301 RepID=A0A5C8Z8B9_9GAMM|nr:malate dehydrogenase (quinone) [Reinekea thalattae]TXR53907.1 malate dehydrogenase (quinone) [Reinekea thalattae]